MDKTSFAGPGNFYSFQRAPPSWIIKAILFSLILLALSTSSTAAIPNDLNVQGKLTSIAGASQQGTFNFTFRIYDNTTSGNVLYEKTLNVTTDANGVYDVILKGITANFSDQHYLGITIGSDSESTPRLNLTSSPYSFRSNVSESLNPSNTYRVENLIIAGNLSFGSNLSSLTLTSIEANLTSNGNLFLSNNLSLGSIIRFSLGQTIDGLIPGWQRISSNLNVTQNASIGGTLFVDSLNGFVGFGTSQPQSKIDVLGDVRISASLNASSINATKAIFTNLSVTDLALGWTNLTGYPASCPVGQFITAVGDILTCAIPGETSSAAGGWANDTSNTYTDLNIVVDINDLVVNTSLNRIGIGIGNPNERLEVIGNVRISGSLNASTINASQGIFVRGNEVQEENTAFKLGNFTLTYDARNDRFQLSNYTSLESAAFRIENFTSSYDLRSDRFSISNFTILYDARSDRFELSNATILIDNSTIIRNQNSSWWNTLYDLRSDRFGNANFTALYDLRNDRFTNANFTAQLALANVGAGSPFNSSGSSVFLNDSSSRLGIGTTLPNASLDIVGDIKLSTPSSIINLSGAVIRRSGNDIIFSD